MTIKYFYYFLEDSASESQVSRAQESDHFTLPRDSDKGHTPTYTIASFHLVMTRMPMEKTSKFSPEEQLKTKGSKGLKSYILEFPFNLSFLAIEKL